MTWAALGMCLSGNLSLERMWQIVLHPDGSYWFLWVLFFISVIFIGCRWLAERLRMDEVVTIAAMCVVLMGTMVVLDFRLFGFQFISYYFLFYTLGYCLHRYTRLVTTNRAGLGIILLLWAALAWSWNMHELPAWMPQIPHVPGSLLQYAYRGLTALLAIVFIFGMAPRALNGAGWLNRWACRIGTVSLGYYTCHIMLMGHVTGLIRRCLPTAGDEVLIATAFVVCLCLTMAVVELIKRNKLTARILLGKL